MAGITAEAQGEVGDGIGATECAVQPAPPSPRDRKREAAAPEHAALPSRPRRQPVGPRPSHKSAVEAPQDAELVPFRIGQDDSALLALPDIDPTRPRGEQALDLLASSAIDRIHV